MSHLLSTPTSIPTLPPTSVPTTVAPHQEIPIESRTIIHLHTCDNVPANQEAPKKQRLPPGHPKAKMQRQESGEDKDRTLYDSDTSEEDTRERDKADGTGKLREARPAPSPKQAVENEQDKQETPAEEGTGHQPQPPQTLAETEQERAQHAATAPVSKAENILSTGSSEGTKTENQIHWPKWVDSMEEQQTTPMRPLHKKIPEILNMSSKQLMETEKQVLTLGLRFAPTPRKTPEPLEYYDKYHDQCLKVYN